MKNKKSLNIFAKANIILGIFAIVFATITVLFIGFPQLFHFFNLGSTQAELATLTQSLDSDFQRYGEEVEEEEEEEEEDPLPPIDKVLPEGNLLIIPKIGVEGEIYEGENSEKLLEKGIWRVDNFGTPEDNIVTILASHRFGYITWSNEHRQKNSFYNLPKTRVGDTFEIVWNQRLYEYEIYRVEEGTEISDYTADIILYTCKLYNSPDRIFRYAKRIN